MRHLISICLALFVGLAMMGCSTLENPIEGPDNSNGTHSSLNKSTAKLKVVGLPPGGAPVSVSGIVTPSGGGKLDLSLEYFVGTKKVSVKMKLTVPKNSVTNSTTITMSLDPAKLLTNFVFSPEGTEFSKPALLDVNASGLDLLEFSESGVDMWYVANGEWLYTVESKKIKIDVLKGTLKASDVQIPHFSRYAFGRADEDGGE